MKDYREKFSLLADNIEKVIVGKRTAVEFSIVAMLCRGHILLEDVPGVGKTILARCIANSVAMNFKRIQFTPDLLPSDVTGVSIFNQKSSEFEFKPGPVFTNVLLADEINRATPRTQSSLLECMEESQVTADGMTYNLPPVFMVIATQNPIELQGTYPLPEAQLDRFFLRINMGYPSQNEEVKILGMQIKEHPIKSIVPVITEDELKDMQDAVKQVYIDKSVMDYIVEIASATRRHQDLALGASPRGALSMMRGVQALALIRGDDHVDPVYVKQIARPVLEHRIIVKPQSRLRGITGEKVIEEILGNTVAPVR